MKNLYLCNDLDLFPTQQRHVIAHVDSILKDVQGITYC
jgi:hypothetical protein